MPNFCTFRGFFLRIFVLALDDRIKFKKKVNEMGKTTFGTRAWKWAIRRTERTVPSEHFVSKVHGVQLHLSITNKIDRRNESLSAMHPSHLVENIVTLDGCKSKQRQRALCGLKIAAQNFKKNLRCPGCQRNGLKRDYWQIQQIITGVELYLQAETKVAVEELLNWNY